MKKNFAALFLALSMLTTIGMAACGGDDSSEVSVSSQQESSSLIEPTASSIESSVEEDILPTKAEVVSARGKVVSSTQQNYDFTLNLTGVVSALGYTQAVEANYDGAYRYNMETGNLVFKRTTSGLLLYDSTEYIYTKNDTQLNLKVDENGKVKKVAALPKEDAELVLVNKPVVSLIDSITAENIVEVQESSASGYAYETKLTFASNNLYLSSLYDKIGGLGTNISLKGVTFENPVGGISLYFNLDESGLNDFCISTNVTLSIKGVETLLTLTYKQKAETREITIPSLGGLIIEEGEIERELQDITTAINTLKQEDAYSVDLFAENQFDPAWNKMAITDSYTARLYKNTVDGAMSFNHSYKYKTHHESEGAEAYEYAIGNIKDGTVYLASYKGNNAYEKKEGVTVDTQFDYIVAPVLQSANEVDCIKKVSKGSLTTYTFYLNKAGATDLQNKMIGLINSNEAEGVVDVNNYLNPSYIVEDAEIVVVLENGEIKSVNCLTELKYQPTGGEFTEYNITLTNKVELSFNQNIEKAKKYEAPGKADGFLDNLESIL